MIYDSAMTLGRVAAVAISLAALMNGCFANRLGLTWEIVVITPRVSRGSDLVFRVETKDPVGQCVAGVDYVWAVDWNSVQGRTHDGTSCKEQHGPIQGPRGPAVLKVFFAEADGSLTEMARAEFQIE